MNSSVKFGLTFALAAIIWSLLEIALANQFGFFQLSTITSILAFLIPLIILLIALRREKQQKPVYHLADAMKTGFVISFIGAAGYSIYLFLLYNIYPQVINPYLTYVEEQLGKAGTSPEEIASTLKLVQDQFSPINQAGFSFVLTLGVGVILSYLIGKRLRTKFSHTEISATPE